MQQVGLVDTTGEIDAKLIGRVAAALNLQIARDVAQFWTVQANVQYLPDPGAIPVGVWPIKLIKTLPRKQGGGFHLDEHEQPYAEVVVTAGNNGWSLEASHETIEMLIDPSGNKMHSSNAIQIDDQSTKDCRGRFNYLVEASDPCEASNYAYKIDGVMVSDFITPRFYDDMPAARARYSFTGAVTRPREVLPGGYITFLNDETDTWQQILYLDPVPKLRTLKRAADDKRSLREWVDSETRALRAPLS